MLTSIAIAVYASRTDGEWPRTYFFLVVIQLTFAAHRYGRSLGLDAVAAARSPIRSTPDRILLAAAT